MDTVFMFSIVIDAKKENLHTNAKNDTRKGLTVKRGYVETTVRISGGVSYKRQKRD